MIVDKDSQVPNSLSIASKASFVIRVESKEEVVSAVELAQKEDLPLFVVGEGANILPQDYVKAVIIILDLKGIEKQGNNLKVEAGEKWDDVVRYAVDMGLSGIEALSAIPGKTGAAPIQNIGAYGTEVSNSIEWVEVYDRDKKEFRILEKEECQFTYRSSFFKKHPEKFIVISVNLKLSSENPKVPKYKDVERYFEVRGNQSPNLKEIREAIMEIRKNKLPDPNIIPNAGSFFTNPILSEESIASLKKLLPEVPIFPFENRFKISAGYLIEKAGFKGQILGNGKVKVYENSALVLTNPSNASFSDLISAKNQIQKTVFEKFGVMLEPEVNILT